LGHVKEGEEIGAEGALELLSADLLNALLRVLLGCIIDQDIEATEGGTGTPPRRRPPRSVSRSALINDWIKRGADIGVMNAYTAAFTRSPLVLH
jgi:hypothetical protein